MDDQVMQYENKRALRIWNVPYVRCSWTTPLERLSQRLQIWPVSVEQPDLCRQALMSATQISKINTKISEYFHYCLPWLLGLLIFVTSPDTGSGLRRLTFTFACTLSLFTGSLTGISWVSFCGSELLDDSPTTPGSVDCPLFVELLAAMFKLDIRFSSEEFLGRGRGWGRELRLDGGVGLALAFRWKWWMSSWLSIISQPVNCVSWCIASSCLAWLLYPRQSLIMVMAYPCRAASIAVAKILIFDNAPQI